MDFSSYARLIFDELLLIDEYTLLWFIHPEYKRIMVENHLTPDENNVDYLSFNEVLDMLKLEVDRRNSRLDKSLIFYDWICDVITNEIDPQITEAENKIAEAILNPKDELINKHKPTPVGGLNFSVKKNK